MLDGDENTKAAERLAKLVEKNDYHIDCGMLGSKLTSKLTSNFYRYVGGIKYTKAGLVIHPLLLSAVDYIKAEHKGVAVTRNKNKINLVLPVKARVIIGDTDKMLPPGEYEFIL